MCEALVPLKRPTRVPRVTRTEARMFQKWIRFALTPKGEGWGRAVMEKGVGGGEGGGRGVGSLTLLAGVQDPYFEGTLWIL